MSSDFAQIKNVKSEIDQHCKIKSNADDDQRLIFDISHGSVEVSPQGKHKSRHHHAPKQAVRKADVSKKIKASLTVIPQRSSDNFPKKSSHGKLNTGGKKSGKEKIKCYSPRLSDSESSSEQTHPERSSEKKICGDSRRCVYRTERQT